MWCMKGGKRRSFLLSLLRDSSILSLKKNVTSLSCHFRSKWARISALASAEGSKLCHTKDAGTSVSIHSKPVQERWSLQDSAPFVAQGSV